MSGDKRKIPVTERQFLWVQDDDKGEVILHVGPTMVSPTAADRVVIDDGQGGFVEAPTAQPQRMIELSDSQYAVLFNPLADKLPTEGPNGKFKSGRNESRPLLNGTRHMIPGPCSFYLRPGQRVEVRDAHELASNQYLVVKVYGEVDQKAPYYEITAKSAAITTATAEDVGNNASNISRVEESEPVQLTRGQLIVIRGLDTQFYIPPTGVDVVPDLSVDAKGTQISAEAARKILAEMPLSMRQTPTPPPPPAPPFPDEFEMVKSAKKRVRSRRPSPVDQSARHRQVVEKVKLAPKLEPPPKTEALSTEDIQALLSNDFYRQALEREMRKARLVRQAVVLGEKEFCVILDADGKRQIKVGPARVFPGPYDSFMTEGSNHRIYYAYELLPQRALWIRFIAPIRKEKLEKKLPRGVKLEDKEIFQPGDEMILTGVNSFFFPFNEIEILHPLTGQPHVGNDHSDVFIEAIGIDQKSGIYVRDLMTGEVKLIRGKQSYLVDPRKEVQITRTVSAEEWNLWIGALEPHKKSQSAVTTPWAISITIPHNTAVLATSADQQRVIEGPGVELLAYDEKLEPMTLSTGQPKSTHRLLKTCYLRTVGNRVSDVIEVETSDFVKIHISVSYLVNFEKKFKDRWFNHENYVGVLCDHLRSLVRSQCRQKSLVDLWPNIPSVIRDTILGERTEQGRKGRLFEDNGMMVSEVEVLKSEILDSKIAELFGQLQRESVSLEISDRQAKAELNSERLRHELELSRLKMEEERRKRQAELETLILNLKFQTEIAELENQASKQNKLVELEAQKLFKSLEAKLKRDQKVLDFQLEKDKAQTSVQVENEKLKHQEDLSYRKAIHALELALIQAQSNAEVNERKAIQPSLVEALTALGDKILLSEVAQNMNLVSLFKGKDMATLFAELLGHAKVQRTIQTFQKTDSEE